MKFQQLKVGQKFEYQGNDYVKISPLLAQHAESGEQKLIPRYAVIVVAGAMPMRNEATPSQPLDSNLVRSAFDKFYDCYLDSLAKLQAESESESLRSMQNRLDSARQQFLRELDL